LVAIIKAWSSLPDHVKRTVSQLVSLASTPQPNAT
jgi:hypothetical protein